MNRPSVSLMSLALLAGASVAASYSGIEIPQPRPLPFPRGDRGDFRRRGGLRKSGAAWEPGCWTGDGAAPAFTRQMRRLAARKARKGGAK